jgi:hypothetical protein
LNGAAQAVLVAGETIRDGVTLVETHERDLFVVTRIIDRGLRRGVALRRKSFRDAY